jgi:hypothetical protein
MLKKGRGSARRDDWIATYAAHSRTADALREFDQLHWEIGDDIYEEVQGAAWQALEGLTGPLYNEINRRVGAETGAPRWSR